MPLTPALEKPLASFRAFVRAEDFVIQDERQIDYGRQFKIASGDEVVTVNFYTTGKILVQGKAGVLKEQIVSWAGTLASPSAPPATGVARMGSDESGKGDYFGPLVIAAAYVDAATEAKLLRLGVRDSKTITDNRILELANDVKILCPHAVVVFEPPRYNELYAELRNLNKVLALGHATALEKLLEKVQCELAIVDQFGDEKYVRQALLEKGKRLKVEQRPQGERDVAVAAASILARERYVLGMETLAKLVGFTLPKGSSDPSLDEVRQRVLAAHGSAVLAKVAKLHFKI